MTRKRKKKLTSASQKNKAIDKLQVSRKWGYNADSFPSL